MSTEYPVCKLEGYELVVQTRSDGLDLRTNDHEGYPMAFTDVISAKEMAKIGLRLCEISMLNDYSYQGGYLSA